VVLSSWCYCRASLEVGQYTLWSSLLRVNAETLDNDYNDDDDDDDDNTPSVLSMAVLFLPVLNFHN
jgi:hypothetical protein